MGVLWTVDYVGLWFGRNLLLRSLWNLSLIATLMFFMGYPVLKAKPLTTYKKHVDLVHFAVTTQLYGETDLYSQVRHDSVLGSQHNSVFAGIINAPFLKEKSAFPFISAKAHIIIDNKSGKILSDNNLNLTLAPASTTKLLTALVALDIYELDEVLEISEACSQVESTKLWLPVGDQYTVNDILHSLLISSAGDAGCTLATAKVSRAEFVNLMNEKAVSLGMADSHFTNPVGLDGANGSHYSSVWDLYLLSKAAVANPVIDNIVGLNDYSFTNVAGDFEVDITSTNRLLSEIPGTVGIKTGRTEGAGEVLVYRYNEDNKDLTIIVMASDDRFLDTRNLLSWTLSSYSWGY